LNITCYKENGPEAIWLNRLWCLMINITYGLMCLLVFVLVVHRMLKLLGPRPTARRTGSEQCTVRCACWGEGEDATLRSMPSLPRYTNEDHARAVTLCPLHCKTKARLRRSLLVPRPHRAQRPMWDSAHCNGPRANKRGTGLICNSLFCNDGL
jgi:hypothetical protein